MANTASVEAVTAQITLLGRFDIVVDGRVLDAAGPQFGERELWRSFGVVATVLAADGQHGLALGAARGEEEDRHDAVSNVRARLVDLLGTDEVARLESDGEALDAAAFTARVRSALAT